MIGRYLEVERTLSYYEESNEGTPIVCIHTAGADSRQWRYLAEHFTGHRVICVDLPGHGKSMPFSLSDRPVPTLKDYSRFVWGLVSKLQLKKPVVIGCSIGGNIALILGTEHSDDIRALICANGAGRTVTFTKEKMQLQGQDFATTRSRCAKGTPESKILEIDWLRKSSPPEVYHRDLVAWNNHDILDDLHLISAPTLLIRGKEDPIVTSPMIRETQDRITNSKMIELDECGHFPMVERPNLFNRALETFFGELGMG